MDFYFYFQSVQEEEDGEGSNDDAGPGSNHPTPKKAVPSNNEFQNGMVAEKPPSVTENGFVRTIGSRQSSPTHEPADIVNGTSPPHPTNQPCHDDSLHSASPLNNVQNQGMNMDPNFGGPVCEFDITLFHCLQWSFRIVLLMMSWFLNL